jgi:hypothetical protein
MVSWRTLGCLPCVKRRTGESRGGKGGEGGRERGGREGEREI